MPKTTADALDDELDDLEDLNLTTDQEERYVIVRFLRSHEGYSAGKEAGFPESVARRLVRAMNPKTRSLDPIVKVLRFAPWPHERHLAGTEAPADPKPTTRRRGGGK